MATDIAIVEHAPSFITHPDYSSPVLVRDWTAVDPHDPSTTWLVRVLCSRDMTASEVNERRADAHKKLIEKGSK